MLSFTQIIALLVAFGTPAVESRAFQQRATSNIWETLPATPSLPTPINTTLSSSNGAQLWMQQYNEAAGGIPVVLIHGGGGYSAYFGDIITRLVANGKRVIAVDRRGHGRSTFVDTDVWTFDMFASEISVQLASLGVTSADWVGWSDGAATTYAALQDATITKTINKAFVFAGFMVPEDTNSTYTDTTIYTTFVSRIKEEYTALQPTASFTEFATLLGTLEATLPQFTTEGLGTIDGSKVAVVGAQYDEAVNLDVPVKLNAAIPGSTLIMLENVSHFAPMQDPDQFTTELEAFLNA